MNGNLNTRKGNPTDMQWRWGQTKGLQIGERVGRGWGGGENNSRQFPEFFLDNIQNLQKKSETMKANVFIHRKKRLDHLYIYRREKSKECKSKCSEFAEFISRILCIEILQ